MINSATSLEVVRSFTDRGGWVVERVFTYDCIEAVARSEGMRPEDLPEVAAL